VAWLSVALGKIDTETYYNKLSNRTAFFIYEKTRTMNTKEYLTEELLEEYAEQGKKISYEFAWYVALVRLYDEMILLLRKEDIDMAGFAAKLGVSERFVQLTYGRYDDRERVVGLPRGRPALLEQVAELRMREPREIKDIEKDPERYERERHLRQTEEFEAVEVLLDAGYYTTAEIAEIVGVTVSYVEEAQAVIAAIRHKYRSN
jgi:hypothetical protein